MHFLPHTRYRAVLTVFNSAGRHQFHFTWLNKQVKNGNVMFLLEFLPSLVFSRNKTLLKATLRKWLNTFTFNTFKVVSCLQNRPHVPKFYLAPDFPSYSRDML